MRDVQRLPCIPRAAGYRSLSSIGSADGALGSDAPYESQATRTAVRAGKA